MKEKTKSRLRETLEAGTPAEKRYLSQWINQSYPVVQGPMEADGKQQTEKNMKLKITIEMDSAAFEGYSGIELARITRSIASELDGQQIRKGFFLTLSDINGNHVGEAKVTR